MYLLSTQLRAISTTLVMILVHMLSNPRKSWSIPSHRRTGNSTYATIPVKILDATKRLPSFATV